MAKGPIPKSNASKRARGNPGKRPIAEQPPVAPTVALLPAGDALPSEELTDDGRRVWNLLAPDLHRLNILRSTDAFSLSRYCMDVVEYWSVSQKLRTKGLTYEVVSNHGKYQRLNPLFAVQERLAARLVTQEDRFGLSPQARQSLMVRAAQLAASQGSLPFGGAAHGDPDAPAPADLSPIGILGGPSTTH